MRIIFIAFLSLVFFNAADAQYKEVIEADRPDQTESPFTVPKGWFQSEWGFGVQNDKSGQRTFLHPTMLNKFGIGRRFEIRLITDFTSLESPLVIPAGNEMISGLQP